MNIISASRRTDIPAFYMPWFMNRLRAGFARYPNPFGGQVVTVSLEPHDVHSIVFWSKFYGPFLRHIDELDARGYRFVCHYTITGAPRALEPHVPPWPRAAQNLRTLAARTSPARVLWRFDPMLLTETITPDSVLEDFAAIAAALEGATERCYFSFASFYGKVKRRLHAEQIAAIDPPLDQKHAMVARMAAIAAGHGMTLHACCQPDLLGPDLQERVHMAHCVDADLLSELFPDRLLKAPARPTRNGCGCHASRDVGVYDTCGYGCVYCYANQNHATARDRLRAHDPAGEMLFTRKATTLSAPPPE